MSEDYTMGEYWRDVSPILKQKNQEQREKHYDERIKYAITQFENNNIPYKLCNENNGHFNLLKDKKVVMSFWSWTVSQFKKEAGRRKDKKRRGKRR